MDIAWSISIFAAINNIRQPSQTWWNDDRMLAFVGLLVSIAGLIVGFYISMQQEESQKLFSQKVLGSIPGVDEFVSRLCNVLKAANDDEHSHVFLMLYWLWFGADRQYPKSKVASITANSSEVMKLIQIRVTKAFPTTIVYYDTVECKPKLRAFFHEVLRYNSEQGYKDFGIPRSTISDEEVDALYHRYESSLDDLVRYAESVNEHTNIICLKAVDAIPALMCAVSGSEPVGFVLLFEHSAIRGLLSAGGFESHEPRMVDTIKEQISAAAGKKIE